LEFIPETSEDEVGGFFSRQVEEERETADMRRIWTLIEEQKREDNLLRREFGWESQSGVSASQMSMHPSQPAFRQSPNGVGGMEDEEAVENVGANEELAVAGDVVDTNAITAGEKTVPERVEEDRACANIAEQDEEDDVGLPWF
jgi:hypothetical protein